jgi:GNAT superfamily N-acetyltransferase
MEPRITPAEPRIRPATASDFGALQALYRFLHVAGDPEVPAVEAERRYADILGRPDQTIYVVEAAGKVTGTYALIFIPGLTHGARDSAIVEDVVVNPDQRNGGIGKRMRDDAMDRCRQRGCYKLVLSSHLQRPDAHRFYERLGFSKHGFSFLIGTVDTSPAAPPGASE